MFSYVHLDSIVSVLKVVVILLNSAVLTGRGAGGSVGGWVGLRTCGGPSGD